MQNQNADLRRKIGVKFYQADFCMDTWTVNLNRLWCPVPCTFLCAMKLKFYQVPNVSKREDIIQNKLSLTESVNTCRSRLLHCLAFRAEHSLAIWSYRGLKLVGACCEIEWARGRRKEGKRAVSWDGKGNGEWLEEKLKMREWRYKMRERWER